MRRNRPGMVRAMALLLAMALLAVLALSPAAWAAPAEAGLQQTVPRPTPTAAPPQEDEAVVEDEAAEAAAAEAAAAEAAAAEAAAAEAAAAEAAAAEAAKVVELPVSGGAYSPLVGPAAAVLVVGGYLALRRIIRR